MASAEEPGFDEGFTHAEEVLADGDFLGPEPTENPVQHEPEPEPVPVTSKELKEEVEKEEKGSGRGGAVHNLKSTLLISGAVVAVVGAIFAIAKKIKEA